MVPPAVYPPRQGDSRANILFRQLAAGMSSKHKLGSKYDLLMIILYQKTSQKAR